MPLSVSKNQVAVPNGLTSGPGAAAATPLGGAACGKQCPNALSCIAIVIRNTYICH